MVDWPRVRNRDPLFLLAAALLHAMVVGTVWVTASPPRTVAELSERAAGERLEFDVELAPEENAKRIEAPPQPIARITESPARPGRLAPRGQTPEAHRDDAPIVEAGPRAPAPSVGALDERPPPAPLPGLDGIPIWAIPGVVPAPPLAAPIAAALPPVVPGAPPPPSGPLAAVIDYLGSGNPPKPSARIAPPQNFPAAGTLASALVTEVRGSSTPADSDSVFELVIDAKGQLASLQVVTADPRHRKEWDRVARAVAQRFAGQTFPLPDTYAQGSRIHIAVTSRLVMPDGTSAGLPTVPMPKIVGLPDEHTIREDSLDDRHRGGPASNLPPIKFALGGKVAFDVANIGAKRRRVIHTRIKAAPLAKVTSAGAADPRR